MAGLAVKTLLVALLALLQETRAEIFTSLAGMEPVLHAEHSIAHDLMSFVKKEEERIAKLRRLAEDFEHHSSEALTNPERHLGNPVNAFLLVKRFTTDWNKIVDTLIRSNSSEEFLSFVSLKSCVFPEQDDLMGAANALMRLQDTYSLSAAKMATGDLGLTKSPELTAEQCYELGRLAYNANDHYHTMIWMQEALERDAKEMDKTIDRSLLLDYLSFSTSMQGNAQHALNLTKEWLSIEPDNVRAQSNKQYFQQAVKDDEEKLMKKGDTGDDTQQHIIKNHQRLDEYRGSEDFQTYEALCRGESAKPVYKYAHKLTCRLRRHHPIFFYRPLKEEVMYLDPFIAVYHDVITDTEIAKVKELAKPRLHRSGVFTIKEEDSVLTNYRTSQSAWLSDFEDPLIQSISLKSSTLSHLTLESVEELQVLNYGIGGHYEPHFDFARDYEKNTFEEWRGNRIATVIYYMNDVETGGATVFPGLGVRVWPEKGACAMWYNLHRNGQQDFSTKHAGCPVLTGSKWVCNKWFHERGQEFSRLCSTNPDE